MPHDRDAAATGDQDTHADQPAEALAASPTASDTDASSATQATQVTQVTQGRASAGASLQLVSRDTFILGTFESFVLALGCPEGMQAISGAYDGLPDGWSASRSAPARDASGTPTGAWAFRFHGPAPGAPVAVTLMAFCTPASILSD